MKNSDIKETGSLIYAKIFFLIFLLALFLSLSYKAITAVRDSSFKGDSFNLLVLGKENSLVHISKSDKKIVVLKLSTKGLNKQNKIEQSMKVGLLVDGVISGNNISFPPPVALIFSSSGNKLSNVNSFDIGKIILYSKTYETKHLDFSDDNVKNLFDRGILEDKISVEVINATDVNGLGSNFSSALKNTGFNVVSVDSEERATKSVLSGIDPSSSTIKRLSNSLGIKISDKHKSPTADIKVMIGEDLFR